MSRYARLLLSLSLFITPSISAQQVDTAGTGAWRPGLEAAFHIAGPDRIMFGTDYPLECKTAANISESLAVIRAAARTPEDRAAILGTTASALFNLAT